MVQQFRRSTIARFQAQCSKVVLGFGYARIKLQKLRLVHSSKYDSSPNAVSHGAKNSFAAGCSLVASRLHPPMTWPASLISANLLRGNGPKNFECCATSFWLAQAYGSVFGGRNVRGAEGKPPLRIRVPAIRNRRPARHRDGRRPNPNISNSMLRRHPGCKAHSNFALEPWNLGTLVRKPEDHQLRVFAGTGRDRHELLA